MPHKFKNIEVKNMFKDKKVVFLGDSIIRDIYKDFVCLYGDGKLISNDLLTFFDKENKTSQPALPVLGGGERMIPGTGHLTGSLAKGRDYEEEREYVVDGNRLARFYFLTKCWSDHLKEFLLRVKKEDGAPDLILILSCLWDTNRWGPGGISDYTQNCPLFLDFIRETFPPDITQLVWLTCPPISVKANHGVFGLPGMDHLKESTRFNVMEANNMIAHNTAAFGFDVVDLHVVFQGLLHWRRDDGIHWSAKAIRLMVNMILQHFADSREISLPGAGKAEEN